MAALPSTGPDHEDDDPADKTIQSDEFAQESAEVPPEETSDDEANSRTVMIPDSIPEEDPSGFTTTGDSLPGPGGIEPGSISDAPGYVSSDFSASDSGSAGPSSGAEADPVANVSLPGDSHQGDAASMGSLRAADEDSYSPTISSEDGSFSPTISSEDGSFDEENSRTMISDDGLDPPDLGQTIQSDEFTDASGASDQTFVSDDDIALSLSKTWGAGIHSATNPHMTIKGVEPGGATAAGHETIPTRKLREKADSQPGEYELIKILGEGGMGIVWNAKQRSIERSVAIKMIKSKAAAKPQQMEKFIAEAIVTGDLEHPNIVPIHELGRDQAGNYFYAMKHVQGTPWNKVIRGMNLHENLDVLLRTCDAIAFAHARGIIHRDLKPENIMLGDFGEVLVMDWGLALPTEEFSKRERISQLHGMGGTPAYMAPEMATGPISRIDYTSDVYLLGAILYEIVTGYPPHRGKTTQQCLAAAMRNVISPTEIDSELVEIARRAMSTDTKQRYKTVKQFQTAIRNYLAHEKSLEISNRATRELDQARESGEYERYSRSMFGFEESLALWTDNEEAQSGLLLARHEFAKQAFAKGDYDLAESLVDPSDPDHEPLLLEIHRAKDERIARQRMLRIAKGTVAVLAATILVVVGVSYYLINLEIQRAIAAEQDASEQRDLAVIAEQEASDQRDLAVLAEQKVREQRDIAEKREQEAVEQRAIALQEKERAETARRAEQYESYIARIGLAAAKVEENAFADARELLMQCPPELRNWEWGRLMYLCSQSSRDYNCTAPVDDLALAPDGQKFATASWDGQVRVWERETGEVLHTLPHEGIYVHAVAWSPDGKWLATGSGDKPHNLKLWDLSDSKQPRSGVAAHEDAIVGLRFSDDGRWLLTCSYDNTARLWDVQDMTQPQLMTTLVGHTWWVWSADFEPGFVPEEGGRNRLVTVGQDGKGILWEITESGSVARPRVEFLKHEGPIYAVAWHPTESLIASAGYDRQIHLWNPEEIEPFDFTAAVGGEKLREQTSRLLTGHIGPVRAVRFSRDGRLLVSGALDNSVRVWDLEKDTSIKTFRGHDSGVRACEISADNRFVLSGAEDQRAILWNVNDYAEIQTLAGRKLSGHADAILSAYFSPTGKSVVTASRDRSARIWNVASGVEEQLLAEGHRFLSSSALFLRDEQFLATAAADDSVRLWNAATGSEMRLLQGTGRAALLAVSDDHKWLATGSGERQIFIWNLDELLAGTGEMPEPAATLAGHQHPVTAFCFVPGSPRLVSGDTHGRCILWETATAEPVWSHRHHTLKITDIGFVGAEHQIATASLDRTVSLLDLKTGQEQTDLVVGLNEPVIALATAGDKIIAVTNRQSRQSEAASTDAEVTENAQAENGEQPPPGPGDCVVTSWTWNSPGERVVHKLAGKTANRLAVDAAGKRAYLTCSDNTLTRVDLLDGTTEIILDGNRHGGLLWACRLSEDGRRLLTVGGVDARLWDLRTGQERMSFGPHGAVAATAMHPAGSLVVTGSWDQSLKFWDVETGRTTRKIPQAHRGYINTVAFSHDGRWLVTGGDDRVARIWNVETGQLVRELTGHTGEIQRAVFAPDDATLVTAASDRTLRLWDAATGETLGEPFQGHRWAVLYADFSPDGSRLLSCSEDNKAILWDVATRNIIRELSGHTAAVTAVRFSPDGQRALTSSRDNTAKLWDVSPGNEGKEILTLKRHAREVTAVDFSADSLRVLTASRDGTAILWPALDWRAPAVATAP